MSNFKTALMLPIVMLATTYAKFRIKPFVASQAATRGWVDRAPIRLRTIGSVSSSGGSAIDGRRSDVVASTGGAGAIAVSAGAWRRPRGASTRYVATAAVAIPNAATTNIRESRGASGGGVSSGS